MPLHIVVCLVWTRYFFHSLIFMFYLFLTSCNTPYTNLITYTKLNPVPYNTIHCLHEQYLLLYRGVCQQFKWQLPDSPCHLWWHKAKSRWWTNIFDREYLYEISHVVNWKKLLFTCLKTNKKTCVQHVLSFCWTVFEQ